MSRTCKLFPSRTFATFIRHIIYNGIVISAIHHDSSNDHKSILIIPDAMVLIHTRSSDNLYYDLGYNPILNSLVTISEFLFTNSSNDHISFHSITLVVETIHSRRIVTLPFGHWLIHPSFLSRYWRRLQHCIRLFVIYCRYLCAIIIISLRFLPDQ